MSASAALLLLSGYYYLPTRVGELIYAGLMQGSTDETHRGYSSVGRAG